MKSTFQKPLGVTPEIVAASLTFPARGWLPQDIRMAPGSARNRAPI